MGHYCGPKNSYSYQERVRSQNPEEKRIPTGIEATVSENVLGRKEALEGFRPIDMHFGYNDNHAYQYGQYL
jgi:hypothetical protein